VHHAKIAVIGGSGPLACEEREKEDVATGLWIPEGLSRENKELLTLLLLTAAAGCFIAICWGIMFS
jgi:hypothetical protein